MANATVSIVIPSVENTSDRMVVHTAAVGFTQNVRLEVGGGEIVVSIRQLQAALESILKVSAS